MSEPMQSPAEPTVHQRGRSIFLISTPIQLLFASLISRQYKLKPEYVLTTDYQPSLTQLEEVASRLNLTPVSRLITPSFANGERLRRMACESLRWLATRRLKKSLIPGDRLFLGMLNHASHRPLFHGLHELAFFDEGTATISVLERRARGGCAYTFPPPKVLTWFTALYPRTVHLEPLHYFTVYPGLSGAPGDTVNNVAAEWPHTLFREKRPVAELWYISSPVVQAGLLSESRNRSILIALRDFCATNGLRLVYYKHRTDVPDPTLSDVEIREPAYPFEVYFGLSDRKPLAMVSIVSSAIIHCKLFFASACPYFYLDPEHGHDAARVGMVQRYAANALELPVLSWDNLATALTRLVEEQSLDA